MPNPVHVLETALLLLAAFLLGCVLGYALRRLTGRRPGSSAQPVIQAAAVLPPGPQLVVAPEIAPLASRRLTPAQRLAATLSRDEADPMEPPQVPAPAAVSQLPAVAEPDPVRLQPEQPLQMAPARRAGQATSGIEIAAPAQEPEAAPAAEALPLAAAPESDPSAAAPFWGETASPAQESVLEPAEPVNAEMAAMAAIEGNWTPRSAPVRRAVDLPEPFELDEERPAVAEAEDPNAAAALDLSRRAVDAAHAAARALLAEPVPEPSQVETITPALEQVSPGAASSAPGSATRQPFGKPAGLQAPRAGRRDDLQQIRGLSRQHEAALNQVGLFHIDQIAGLGRKEVVWLDSHLALRGRIDREGWVEQARQLLRRGTHPPAIARR